MLRVGESETGKNDTTHIGAPVSVRVFHIPNIGSSRDQDSFFPAHDTVGENEPIGEHGAMVGAAIPISVFQQRHPPGGTSIERIARHFDDKNPSVFVKLHCHWRADQGFTGKQFNAKAFLNSYCLEGFLGGIGRTSATAASTSK